MVFVSLRRVFNLKMSTAGAVLRYVLGSEQEKHDRS